MIKQYFLMLVLFLFCTNFMVAQTEILTKLPQETWVYKDYETAVLQQNVEKKFLLRFEQEGKGRLQIFLTYTTDGEAPIQYYGTTSFSHQATAEADSTLRNFPIDISYETLSFEPMLTHLITKKETMNAMVDQYLMNQMITEFSNKKARYDLQLSGTNLMVEGFAQNKQSAVTYFTSNPVSDTF